MRDEEIKGTKGRQRKKKNKDETAEAGDTDRTTHSHSHTYTFVFILGFNDCVKLCETVLSFFYPSKRLHKMLMRVSKLFQGVH